MMKKYILILLSVLCCIGCDREDETVDITVMPPATTIGAETFGCLIDGWLYVGGRYRDYGYWFGPSVDSPSIKFLYNEKQAEVDVSVMVKQDRYIRFTIVSPQEGQESEFTNARFGEEKLKNGTVTITRFDTERNIISGTCSGGRITNGRFDVHYKDQEEDLM